MKWTIPTRAFDAAFVTFAVASLVVAALLIPNGGGLGLPGGEEVGELCWVHALLGLDCPFCGLSRSFVAMLHGDLVASFQFHPAGPLMVVFVAAAGAWMVIAGLRRSPPVFERRAFGRSLHWVAVIGLAAGFLRYLVP